MLFGKGKQDKSVNMSLPEEKDVHGVIIVKAPMGRYIQSLKDLADLPEIIADKLFPGQKASEIFAMFVGIDRDGLITLATRLMTIMPDTAVETLCKLMGVDYDVIMNEKTPKQFVDIVKAWWAMNDMSSFFADVWGPLKKWLPTLIIGSSAQSQSPKQ